MLVHICTMCVCDDSLVEETNDLARDVLATSLFMVHNSRAGGKDDVAELTRWQ